MNASTIAFSLKATDTSKVELCWASATTTWRKAGTDSQAPLGSRCPIRAQAPASVIHNIPDGCSVRILIKMMAACQCSSVSVTISQAAVSIVRGSLCGIVVDITCIN